MTVPDLVTSNNEVLDLAEISKGIKMVSKKTIAW